MSDDLGPPDRSNTGWALFWRQQDAAPLTPSEVDMFIVALLPIVVLGSKYFGFW